MSRKILKIVQGVIATAVVGYAIYTVARQWTNVRSSVMSLDLHWGMLLIASAIVFLVYMLLIETWRKVLAAWDTKLLWGSSARIWFASSLGKYVPGYIWALTAMGMMAKQKGASAVAAAGSSIIVNVLNLVSGLAVILLCGSRLIPHTSLAIVILLVALALVAVMPKILPWLSQKLCQITKRNIPIPHIPATTIWLVVLWTGIAWIGYGIAFQFFAQGMLALEFSLEMTAIYIAVYTGAYILGLVSSSVAVAGLGVREAGLVAGLRLFGVMGQTDAWILAITCRLWLTMLEIVPAIIALAVTQTKVSKGNHPSHQAETKA